MRAIRAVGPVCLMLALAMPAVAQEEGRSFGLGVGVEPSALITEEIGFLAFLSPQLYVPFAVGESVMVEPSFGVFRFSIEREFDGETATERETALRLGVGVLFARDAGSDGRVYAGPRVGIVRYSSDEEYPGFDRSETRVDWLLAAVTGGEYFLAPGLSLGGELGLEWVNLGQPDITPAPTFEVDESGSVLRTVTAFRVRWYLN